MLRQNPRIRLPSQTGGKRYNRDTHVEGSEEKRKTAVQFRTAPREGGHRFDPGQLGSALAVAQWQSALVKRRVAPARITRTKYE